MELQPDSNGVSLGPGGKVAIKIQHSLNTSNYFVTAFVGDNNTGVRTSRRIPPTTLYCPLSTVARALLSGLVTVNYTITMASRWWHESVSMAQHVLLPISGVEPNYVH